MTPKDQAEAQAREFVEKFIDEQVLRCDLETLNKEDLVELTMKELLSNQADALAEAEKKARNFSVGYDVEEWMLSTKKEMSVKVLLSFADWLHEQAAQRRVG